MSADGERSLYDELEKPTVDRRIRQLPRLLRDAVGIVRRAGGTTFKVALALQLLASASVLVQLLVVRSLLTRLIAERQHVQVGDIVGPLVVLVICLGVTAAASVARTAQQELLADLVSRETLYRVLQRAGRVELLEFETSRLHDRLQRAIFNGTFRPLQMTSGLLAVLAGAGGSIGIGIALLAISPIFFVLAIASAVPVWLLGVVSSRVMYRFAYEQTRRDRDRLYLQDLQSERREAKELRAYDLNEHLLGLWRANYDRRIADLRGVVRRRVRSGALASFLSAALLAVAIAALVELVRTGHLSLGAAGAALGGLVVLGAQLQTLGAGIGAVYESALFVQDYTQFVDAPPDPGEYAGFTGTQPAAPFAAVSGRDIGFTYPSGNRAALTGVDIDVAAGEIVALVGENGSGKSTLTKVLAGLYPAGAGTVCWNGADVGTLAIESVRDQVAVLFQDFVRFELTLADNVGFGRWRRAADEAALQHAADMAGAGAVVAGLPDGWASRMGPEYAGGRELSGGQWQRLAIARALFRDAPLVILDEPTAALDPRAEAALFRDVRTLFAGRSVVLVSHRFGSVRTADRIYVLHEGAVVEVGNHDELVAANGRYAEMYRLQRATLLGD
ncbi:MAG TPA: ABC transporter ATP-binding protein [Jatrophihabitantaceae bacterium]